MANKNFIRIIPKLDIKNGMLIKGINLEGLRVLGDPFNFAKYYYNNLADEICYVDNVATLYGTNNLSTFISNTAKNIFIPISVGGGIRSIQDIERIFKAGADKVCINSAAIDNPKFLYQASRIFGSANITIIIEYIKIKNKYFITKSTGRDMVAVNPFDWAKKVEQNGAGEIFLTSVNHEGLKSGFDINVIKKISQKVSIPVIAHGGAGSIKHVIDVVRKTNVSGVAISSLAHYDIANIFKNKKMTLGNVNYLEGASKKKKPKNMIKLIKKNLKKEGFNVRI
ncbi:imidazole glycerol phosphate synthase cyclase subunit [Pelagibacteraceae bacterium]|nr:imidazole glycerol phosphate synthase cyclase subunit [Pelagibacteraceae bacterium]